MLTGCLQAGEAAEAAHAAEFAHALHLFCRAGTGELLHHLIHHVKLLEQLVDCLLYTSDAADEL